MSKQLFIGVVLVALLGCEKTPPEHIRFGLSSAVVTLDPRFATDATSSRLCRLIYDSLVGFDEAFRPVPSLATWVAESPMRYVFTLKSAARFHDGSALTAADVVATYRSILASETASPHRGSLNVINKVYAVGDTQIVFELSRAEPLFPGLLTIGILPKPEITQSKGGIAQAIVGSGPFRVIDEWNDKTVVLKRVADGLAVQFQVIRDPTVRALKLVNNEIDIIQGGVAPEIAAWLGERSGISTYEYPGTTFTYLGLNLDDEVLAQKAVREALALAVDREEIARHLFAGRARLAKSIFTPEHWVYHDALGGINYNPNKAKKILSELGFSSEKPLRLTYKTSSDLFRLRVATVIQDQLSKVGIELDIQSFDWGTFYGDVKAGRFQMYSLSWVGLKLPDIFRYVFHSDSVPPKGANRGRYRSGEIDTLIERAEQMRSLSQRSPLYQKIQARILLDLPYIPLWYEDHTVVIRDEIAGYTVSLDGNYDALAFVKRR